MALTFQPSFFDLDTPTVDDAFAGLVRHRLDERTWVDHCPGWLAGAGTLLDELVEGLDWEQRRRVVYEVEHLEPRLTAGVSPDALPPVLVNARDALSERYGVAFDSCWCNLYRDGHDAVAWHRDRVHRVLPNPLVVTISLGARRPFLLRLREGHGRSTRFEVGEGDLLVMGGACQHEWEHCVPRRVNVAGARLSVTMRHGGLGGTMAGSTATWR